MRILFYLFFFLCALQSSIHAEEKWAINGQWLFLAPTFDDSYFVLEGGLDLDVKRHNSDYHFRPAARVEVAYADPFYDLNLAVSYTYLCARKNFSYEDLNRFLAPTDNTGISVIGPFATTKNQILYQGVDALVWKTLWNPSVFQLNLVFGAEYAYARLLKVTEFSNPEDGSGSKFTRNTRFIGIGPEMGFDLGYHLSRVGRIGPGQFNFNFRVLGSLLASHTVSRQAKRGINITLFQLLLLEEPEPEFRLADEATWRIIPAFHARSSLSYDLMIARMNTSLEIGYEFNSYVGAFAKGVTSIQTSQMVNEYMSFNTQGPFVGLNLMY